jgi:chromosomal replication initiation ATPase DnaA
MATIAKVPIDYFPEILRVLNNAQKEIAEITSIDVRLSINVFGEPKYADNVAWLVLQQAISNCAEISWERIKQKTRKKPIPMLKALYCYIGYKRIGGKSQKDICRDLGYNDHTDVINGIRRFQHYIDTKDPEAMKLYSRVLKVISQKKETAELNNSLHLGL